MDFTELELLYLRHLVVLNMDTVQRRMNKYQRYYDSGRFDEVYQEKIACAEMESLCMKSIREKLNYAITLQTLRK